MFASLTLSVVFTLVFAATGGYALLRLSRLSADPDAGGDRLVELLHLVMSLAMIAMTWGWTGDPTTAGGALQIVVFGAFAAWFGYHALAPGVARGRLVNGYHALAAAAMVWMVVAMPLLMGMAVGADSGAGGHGGHHGSADPVAAVVAPIAPVPGWAVAVSVGFVIALLVAAGWWAVRVVRPSVRTLEPVGGSGGAVSTCDCAEPARGVAGCHLAMSVGMAAMFVAMF